MCLGACAPAVWNDVSCVTLIKGSESIDIWDIDCFCSISMGPIFITWVRAFFIKCETLVSSPEPKAHWWAYRINRLPSYFVVHTLQTSPQKPLGQSVRFHMELPWDGGKKVCSSGPDHMTKLASCPYMVKTLKNLWNQKADDLETSLEPKGRWPWNFVCIIRCSSTSKFVQMMTLGWPWPILQQGQIWSLMLLYGKRVKQWIFQKQLLTKWHEPIWISKIKIIHWPWSKVTQIQHLQTSFPLKPLGRLKPNFMWSLHWMGEGGKVYENLFKWSRTHDQNGHHSQGARNLIRTSYLPEKVWMQKQKELTFCNISRHVVKSNFGSSFPGWGLFCTYPILFLLKQSYWQ